MPAKEINWPDQYNPKNSAVHVVNSLQMESSIENIWDKLISATDWPDWYPNAANVRLHDTEKSKLELGTKFRWKTFGVTINCIVEEYEPFERLAWSSESRSMSVYHAWLITPNPQGCHVLTEETQNGLIPKVAKTLMPGRMHKFHQIWLEGLDREAQLSS